MHLDLERFYENVFCLLQKNVSLTLSVEHKNLFGREKINVHKIKMVMNASGDTQVEETGALISLEP